ncbi:hypothetical protein RZS08_66550, partial [Arthrospira platensis SPKY1]|nr:hypothetical protein [Arthrospira platensis SPKY1]
PLEAALRQFTIIAQNGSVELRNNGVLIASTSNGPVLAASRGAIVYELQNGATAANFRYFVYSDSEAF